MKRAHCHVRSVQDMSLSMSGVTEAQTLIPPTRIVSRVTGKLEIIADGGICRATGRTKLARYSPTDHSLRFGLNAPPTASQAFALGRPAVWLSNIRAVINLERGSLAM